MLLQDINLIEKKATAVIKSTESLKKSVNISNDEFLKTALSIQVNAEKLCLKARLLPLRSGHPMAMEMVKDNISSAVNISIYPVFRNWMKITIPALLPKKETGGVEYIRDSLNEALNKYFKNKEKNIYSEPVILIFNHIYSKWYNGRRFRDHDNIEINAVADLITLNFLSDDNPTNCQHFQYTTEGEEDSTVIYLVPYSDFSFWVNKIYLPEMNKQDYVTKRG